MTNGLPEVLLIILNPLTILAAVIILKGAIMSDIQNAVDEITAVLVKARTEIVAALADLEVAAANGQTPDLTALRAVADSLEAIVDDEEPAVEEPAGE